MHLPQLEAICCTILVEKEGFVIFNQFIYLFLISLFIYFYIFIFWPVYIFILEKSSNCRQSIHFFARNHATICSCRFFHGIERKFWKYRTKSGRMWNFLKRIESFQFFLKQFRPEFLQNSEKRLQVIRKASAYRAEIEAARKVCLEKNEKWLENPLFLGFQYRVRHNYSA